MKRIAALIIAFVLLCTVSSGCGAGEENSEPALPSSVADGSYNRLQTITVFGEDRPNGSGIPELEPHDETSLLPSAVIGSSMTSILLRNWAVTDLSLYVPNGYISMEIRGDVGGENFEIGFEELKSGETVSSTVNTEGIASITTEWNTVSIPISAIVNGHKTDLSNARQLLIGNASSPCSCKKHFNIFG